MNLDLARSLTVDRIEARSRFWLFGLVEWWVRLLPRSILTTVVAAAYLFAMGGGGGQLLERRFQRMDAVIDGDQLADQVVIDDEHKFLPCLLGPRFELPAPL